MADIVESLTASIARANEQRGLCACGSPGDGTRCWWPTFRYVLSKAHQIRHGDYFRMRPWDDASWKNQTLRVTEIEAFPFQLKFTFERRKKVEGLWQVKLEWAMLPEISDVVIRAIHPCGAAVCDLHGRDPGEGRRVCQAHAMSWQKVS